MKNKCEGCGAKIQTTDPKKVGFIRSEVYLKNPDNFLCERCFNLQHYNKNVEIEYNEADFHKNINAIANSKGLVVSIVDIFDLEGTFIYKLNEYFPDNNIILVANKFDLFLSSVRVGKVKNYLMNLLHENNIKVKDVLLISAYKDEDINRLINTLVKFQDGKDIYFFGMTNVGKSSIINALIKKTMPNQKLITVSNAVSTTLDFIKIPLGNKTYILDTPGIINKEQITYYLTKETMNKVTPKKYIKPKTFQLNPEQALFIGAFCVVKFVEGIRSSFTTNFSNDIVIHRTKLSNADKFYIEHKEDILKLPNIEELDKLGELTNYSFEINNEKKDIAISGLGFISINGYAKIIIQVPNKIKISYRNSII